MALVSVLGKGSQLNSQNQAQIPWLKYTFRNQHFFSRSSAFVLVPHLAFKPEFCSEYLKLAGIESKHTAFDEAQALKAFLVYPKEIENTESNVFGHLLNQLMLANSHDYPNFLHFHIDVDGLAIIVCKEGTLQMANRFKFKAKEDILYYISASANQFGLDMQKDKVSYSGFLRPKTELKNLLHHYIAHLEPFIPGPGIQFDVAINPQQQHFYADVFTLPLCAL